MPGKPLSSERTWYSFSTHPGELAQTKGTKTREFGCGLTLTIRSTVDITATTPNQPLGTCHVEKWDDQETSSQLLAWLFKVAKLTSTRKRWDTFSFWINNLNLSPFFQPLLFNFFGAIQKTWESPPCPTTKQPSKLESYGTFSKTRCSSRQNSHPDGLCFILALMWLMDKMELTSLGGWKPWSIRHFKYSSQLSQPNFVHQVKYSLTNAPCTFTLMLDLLGMSYIRNRQVEIQTSWVRNKKGCNLRQMPVQKHTHPGFRGLS